MIYEHETFANSRCQDSESTLPILPKTLRTWPVFCCIPSLSESRCQINSSLRNTRTCLTERARTRQRFGNKKTRFNHSNSPLTRSNSSWHRLLYYPPLIIDHDSNENFRGSSTYCHQKMSFDESKLGSLDIKDDEDETHVKEEDVNKTVTRCGAHCDYGTFTLLVQDSEGGLEVQLPNSDKWQRVGHLPGAGECRIIFKCLFNWMSSQFSSILVNCSQLGHKGNIQRLYVFPLGLIMIMKANWFLPLNSVIGLWFRKVPQDEARAVTQSRISSIPTTLRQLCQSKPVRHLHRRLKRSTGRKSRRQERSLSKTPNRSKTSRSFGA